MKLRVLAVVGLAFVCAEPAQAQQEIERIGTAVVQEASGGPVRFDGARGLVVGDRSTLELRWLMVQDSTLGLGFDGPAGVKGVVTDGDVQWYQYEADLKLVAYAPVTAFEVRVLTFNVWNEFTGTISFTQLEDLRAGQRRKFKRFWGWYGEGLLRAHRTSVAYLARVRLLDGRVVVADPAPALKAVQRIQPGLTLRDLEPQPEPPQPTIF